MKNFLFFAAFIASSSVSVAAASPTILVAPFGREAKDKSQHHHVLGLPLILAESLEKDDRFTLVNGPLVLTKEQAQLADKNGAVDLERALALARSAGATRLITGQFSGPVWQWKLTVEVYAVAQDGWGRLGSSTVEGDQTVAVSKKRGGTNRVVSTKAIHQMLAQAATGALHAARMPTSVGAFSSLVVPRTKDSYAYILLARAYDRYFNGQLEGRESALEVAGHAVNVDPEYVEARRFYAHLLLEAGQRKKARLHYEEALKRSPADGRVILALGGIELAEGDADAARGHLLAALAERPGDSLLRYHLARAHLLLGQTTQAQREFERVRTERPAFLEARRELVKIYAAARLYRPAAVELEAIVAAAPGDSEAAFQLGAFLRVDHRWPEAVAVYEQAVARFPQEPLFRKFLFDVGREQSEPEREHAGSAYPSGRELMQLIAQGDRTLRGLEEFRANLQLAANDVVLLLHGRKDCAAAAPASFALALGHARAYRSLRHAVIRDLAASVELAFANREDKALTPDVADLGRQLLRQSKVAEAAELEINAVTERLLPALMTARRCPTDAAAIAMADLAQVRARNAARIAELPKVPPPTSSLAITPVVPPNPTRIIHFTVDNTRGTRKFVLTLDGKKTATVLPGSSLTLTSSVGQHTLCLLPEGHPQKCGDLGTVHHVPLYEGWTITINP